MDVVLMVPVVVDQVSYPLNSLERVHSSTQNGSAGGGPTQNGTFKIDRVSIVKQIVVEASGVNTPTHQPDNSRLQLWWCCQMCVDCR